MIRLARPELGAEEREAVARVLASGMLVQGSTVQAFERAVAERVGRAHAVAVSSGTAALELALRALEVRGEVIVPDLSWPSPGHAAVLAGAAPVLADVDPLEWNAAPAAYAAARGPRTAAAIVIDQFGAPARHGEIDAALSGLPIVEDAACAIGSTLQDRACGSFGVVSCLSFHPRKVLTTGEGGMCLTDDARLAEALRTLRNHGQRSAGEFVVAAPNLRLGELAAAIGLAQLGRLDRMLEVRRALAARYRTALAELGGLVVQALVPGACSNEQTFGVVLPEGVDRAALLGALAGRGIEAARLSYALHEAPSLGSARRAGSLGTSSLLAHRGLALPLHTGMGPSDVDRVVEALGQSLVR